MKKLIASIIIVLFTAVSVYAWDITYSIEEATKADTIAKFVHVHENKETICDPTWRGAVEECPQIPAYTDEEWMIEYIYRWIGRQLDRGGKKLASDDAKQKYTPVKSRVTIRR